MSEVKHKYVKQALSASKRMMLLASALFLILLLGNAFSSIKVHQDYQQALMDSVTNNVLLEYQEHLTKLRLEVDQFQFRNQKDIRFIATSSGHNQKSAYTALLNKLKSEIEHTRLFAIVDQNGQGTLKHITGDFLPDCKEEIHSTLSEGIQEHLFLHHSKTSVHFDILQPLITNLSEESFFFVAFKPIVFEELLSKYQLPFQQLYLLRSDNIGKIELTTVEQSSNTQVAMTLEQINEFSYVKDIPGTRWQLAIKLSPEYSNNIIVDNVLKALFIWFLITCLIYLSYRLQKSRIKRQRQVEEELAFSTGHDSLTGLMNRTNFISYLNKSLDSSKTIDEGVVLLIDIDQFQLINNTHGYATGDSCLHLLSLSIKRFLPYEAKLSRMGNDEFAVLLPSMKHEEAKAFAKSLRMHIQQLNFAEVVGSIKVTASIGILNLDGKCVDTEQIFSALNQAVTVAKQKGRNRVQAYQSDDFELKRHAEEMAIVSDIHEALKSDRFVLYRQHVKSLSGDESIDRYEVLVRMFDAKGNMIAPNLFIPASEKYGVITQIDKWVIKATCESIAQENAQGNFYHYGVNLSGITIGSKDIIDFVCRTFEQFDIDPKHIGFEITETAAITHLESAKKFIDKMTELGCHFSLDDFGSGISSFSYLQQLPVHGIKIDGAFVRDIDSNPLDQLFVEMIQRIAHQMGKKTIAEFVENQAIEDLLIEMGVDFAQGYHIHKPQPWFEYSKTLEEALTT